MRTSCGERRKGALCSCDRPEPLPRFGDALGTLQSDAVSAMTRHDFEAWLDHHLDQAVLVEWRSLHGGEVRDMISTIGVLRKEGGEYLAGDAHIDLTDFEAADFGSEGVIVELVKENVELYVAVS